MIQGYMAAKQESLHITLSYMRRQASSNSPVSQNKQGLFLFQDTLVQSVDG